MPEDYKNNDIFEAVQNNDEISIKHFVEEENVPVTVTNVLGETAAHIAASKGELNILKYLIEKNASLVEMRDRWQQTVLLVAVKKGELDVVEYLVNTCKAKIIRCSPIFDFNSVLHIAAEGGHLYVLEFFVEKKNMDVNERNSIGQTPVFLAANHDHVHVVEYLVDKKADVTRTDNEERTILHMCAEYGYLRVPKFLLDQRNMSLDVNCVDSLGRSLLYLACKNGNVDFIKYFVEERHADIDLADNRGWTPLHLAAFLGDLRLVQYFYAHGADLLTKDVLGKTVLNSTTDSKVIKYLQEAMENKTRSHGETVLDSTKDPEVTNMQETIETRLRRSVPQMEQFAPKAVQTFSYAMPKRIMEPSRGIAKCDLKLSTDSDTSFGIDRFFMLANAFIKGISGRTSNSQRVSKLEETLHNKVQLTAADAINSIFYSQLRK